MADKQRVAEVLMRFRVDDAALKNVLKANTDFSRNLSNVGAGTRQLSENAKKAQAELVKLAQAGKIDGSSFAAAAREIALADARVEGLNQQLEETKLRLSTLDSGEVFEQLRLQAQLLENEINSVNQSIASAGRGSPTTQGGVERAGAVDTAFGRASSIISALPAGGEIANLAGLVSDLSAGFKEMPEVLDAMGIPMKDLLIAAPLAGAALAILAVGIANFQQVTAEARANLDAALTAQENYYQAVATLDEEGARQRITELERNIEAQRQRAEEARGAADSAFNQLAGQIGDAAARAAFALDPTLQGLASNATNAEAGLAAMEQEVTRLNQGLEQGVFAANNAVQSQEELAAATELATQATLNAINERISSELEYARLAENASSESIKARIEENQLRSRLIEEEIASLTLLAAAGDEVAQQALPALREQLNGLRADTDRLTSDVLGSAQARERESAAREEEAAAAEEAADAERDRKQAVQESTAAVTESEKKIAEIRASAVQKAIELEQQRSAAISKAGDVANKALVDLARKNNKALTDEDKRYMAETQKALEKFRQEEMKTEAANKKERLRAIEDLQDSLLSAEEDNDVIAFIRAQREGEKNLERLTEDADEATRIRTDQFLAERAEALAAHNEKIVQLKEAAVAERDAIMARRDEAIAAANEQFADQSRRLQEQTRQAIDRERSALQQQLQNIAQKYNVEQMAGKQTAETIKQAFLAAAQAVKSAVDAASMSGRSGGSSGSWDTSGKWQDDKKPPPPSSRPYTGPGNGNNSVGGGGSKGKITSGNFGARNFLKGGIVLPGREVLGRFERERSVPEAVIPLDPDTIQRTFAGVFGRDGGGSQFHMHGDVYIGEGNAVTVAEVTDALNQMGGAILEGIYMKRRGAG